MISALLVSVFLAASSPSSGAGPVIVGSTNQGSLGDLQARMQQLEEQNRRMQGRTEELEHKLDQMEARNKVLQQELSEAKTAKAASIVNPAAGAAAEPSATEEEPATEEAEVEVEAPAGERTIRIESSKPETPKPKITITGSGPALTEKPVNITESPNDDFEKAFNYMTDGFLNEAKSGFNAFVKKYPSSQLAGEAYYWLGEMAFDSKEYSIAAINYLKGYKEYPKGTKAPENILKLATTLKTMGKNDEACTNLKRFDTEFKTAHANLRAKAANDRKELKCK